MKRRDSRGSLVEQGRAVEPEAEAERDESLKNDGQTQLHGVEEDLRDFLAADMLEVPVDPTFKERLRRELWEMVEQNAAKLRAERGEIDPGSDSEE